MAAISPQARSTRSVDPQAVIALLRRWFARALPAEVDAWLASEIERQRVGLDQRRLGVALGLAGRKLRHLDLGLLPEDLAASEDLRGDWQPQYWAADEAARIALVLATHNGDDRAFAQQIDKLCVTAEINEHVSYLKGLAIFPSGELLHDRAREGIRSSIGPIFEAVACRNPYPRDFFGIDAWNQMIVKCVFGGTPLEKVVGLHERRNDELIVMLRDLVAERHAAGRPLPKEVHDFVVG